MRSAPGRRAINVSLLVAGMASGVSGFLIQLNYHMGHGISARAARAVWGWGYPTWALFHQISSAVMLAITAWHLYLNRKPLLSILRRAGAWQRQGPIFLTTFAVAVATAFAAWAAAEVFGHQLAERAAVEVHDKVVLVMSVFLALHVWQRRSRLLPMARRTAAPPTSTAGSRP